MSLALIKGQLHRCEPVLDPSLSLTLEADHGQLRVMCGGEPVVAGVNYHCISRGTFDIFRLMPSGSFEYQGNGTAILRAVLGFTHIDVEFTA